MATTLFEKLETLIPRLREERSKLLHEHADAVISQVTVGQAIGGMRGVKGMVCDTSLVDPDKGLSVRGIPILNLKDKLPEEIFWLLVTGEMPSADELAQFQKDLKAHGEVPNYVWKVLKAMPKSAHPMSMLDTAILTMEAESEFRRQYNNGIGKEDLWRPVLEDCLKVIGTIHTIAAGIYRMKYKKGDLIEPSKKLDWAADYAKMLGLPQKKGETAAMMRMYMVLHSDHEGGNVSAFTCHTVGSALSDPFYAVSAGLNGLAGPLHGLANQECLRWALDVQEKFNGVPTEEQIREFTWETLNHGHVIPGYGHAVLRATDPRFTALHEFGKKFAAKDPLFQIIDRVFKVVPEVLKEQGKAKNPWPNVDAGSGVILYHYGLTEFEYYTVLFSVSRSLGMSAQLILDRALGSPIVRPKSVSTRWLIEQVTK
jgi:citrate synthase